jgi:predicted TPR repeat methyltransferase
MIKNFLEDAYTTRDAEATRGLYDRWSASYEAEMGGNGYATPARCAAALAAHAPDRALPLLDFGCGTGLAGQAFKDAGFSLIDGMDVAADMLAQARAKDIYRDLTQIESGAPLSTEHTLIAAVGVIGAGAAPVSTLDSLLHALPSDGLLVFSFNDHALADPQSTGRLNEWLDCGSARLLFAQHGLHLPALGMEATIYVVQKV